MYYFTACRISQFLYNNVARDRKYKFTFQRFQLQVRYNGGNNLWKYTKSCKVAHPVYMSAVINFSDYTYLFLRMSDWGKMYCQNLRVFQSVESQDYDYFFNYHQR
jgi:hypothetical protein